jgi:hypothetical protein
MVERQIPMPESVLLLRLQGAATGLSPAGEILDNADGQTLCRINAAASATSGPYVRSIIS